MKILILSDLMDHSQGSAMRLLRQLVNHLTSRGLRVHLISRTGLRREAITAVEGDLTIHRVLSDYDMRFRTLFSIYNPDTVPEVERIMGEVKPDVVHAYLIHIHLSYHTMKLAKKRGIPVLYTAHDCMPFCYHKFYCFINKRDLSDDPAVNYKINPFHCLSCGGMRFLPFRNTIIRRYFNRYVDRLICVSEELAKAYRANGFKNVTVVHNGLEMEEEVPSSDAVSKFVHKLGLADRKVILFGGRLSYLKGGSHIIAALARVVKSVENAALLVMGEREGYAREMESLARRLGVDRRVVFAGFLKGEELKCAYVTSRVVVIPSVCMDCFPTMNLEAMALKRPLISTCFGGSKEIVVNGVTGFIVNPMNLNAMAEKITYLLQNEEEAMRMGEAGYRRFKEKFTSQIMGREVLSLYEEVLRRT